MTSDRTLVFWGGAMVALVIVAAIGADYLAPADPLLPTDSVAGRHLPPGAHRLAILLENGDTLLAEQARLTPSGLEIQRLDEWRTLSPDELAPGAMPERRIFVLGTDRFGRDLLSRLLHGARVSIWIGTFAAALALLIGIAIGALAATAGGVADAMLMRLTDALLAFPNLFIVIAIAAVFEATPATIILILGLTGWMGTARLIRAELLTLKQRDFVLAADAVGQSPGRILVRHLLPNALTPVIAYTALRIGDIILIEASLSFLGLGVIPPEPTWGNMIAESRDALSTAWWVATFPGLAIAFTLIGFHLTGDGLRAWLDPRSGQG